MVKSREKVETTTRKPDYCDITHRGGVKSKRPADDPRGTGIVAVDAYVLQEVTFFYF